MKTYCAISRGEMRVFSADYIYEIDPLEIMLHEDAVRQGLQLQRPMSIRVAWGWVTHNAPRVPRVIGATSYIIVRPLCQA